MQVAAPGGKPVATRSDSHFGSCCLLGNNGKGSTRHKLLAPHERCKKAVHRCAVLHYCTSAGHLRAAVSTSCSPTRWETRERESVSVQVELHASVSARDMNRASHSGEPYTPLLASPAAHPASERSWVRTRAVVDHCEAWSGFSECQLEIFKLVLCCMHCWKPPTYITPTAALR